MKYNITTIYNSDKTDLINIYNPNCKFGISDVYSKFLSSYVNKNNLIKLAEDSIINSIYCFEDIAEWFDLLEKSNKIENIFPSLENSIINLLTQSLTGFRLLPFNNIKNAFTIKQPKDSDLILSYKNNYKYSRLKSHTKSKIKDKEIDLFEFSIIRISSNSFSDQYQSIDLKIRDFDKKKILSVILSLPEFWRNFHYTTRDSLLLIPNNPTYEINKTLSNFYVNSKRNNNFSKTKEEAFEFVKSKNILSLSSDTFANQLMFRLPGLALPLTVREQLWSVDKDPAIEIFIDENEINLISFKYSDNYSVNKDILRKFSDDFSTRELAFANKFELPKYSGGKFLITSTDRFAYIYESNMIDVFDSLTKLDSLYNK